MYFCPHCETRVALPDDNICPNCEIDVFRIPLPIIFARDEKRLKIYSKASDSPMAVMWRDKQHALDDIRNEGKISLSIFVNKAERCMEAEVRVIMYNYSKMLSESLQAL